MEFRGNGQMMSRPTQGDPASVAALVSTLSSQKPGAGLVGAGLVEAIEKFHGALAPSPARDSHFASLRSGKALTVVTGQQLGLFGGPLLTFYKALSCIQAARQFSQSLNLPVVPIFWMQTEDHDLAEIDTATVISEEGVLMTADAAGRDARANRRSVGELQLQPAVSDALDLFQSGLGKTAGSEETFKLLRESYRPGVTWSHAFRGFIGELFSSEGLILFDIRDAAIQAAAAPLCVELFRAALERSSEVDSLAEQRNDATVPIRKGSPLFFLTDEHGERYRLSRSSGGDFAYLGRQGGVTRKELEQLIVSEPGRFSTSALLRPLLQDRLFPTLAYVGGDAELSYHRQIEPLYPLFGAALPLLLPRASLRFLDPRSKRLLQELGLSPEQIRLPEHELLCLLAERKILGGTSPIDVEKKTAQTLDSLLSELQVSALELDPALGAALNKTEGHVRQAFQQFQSRYTRAYLSKNSIVEERLIKLRAALFPHGQEQERVLSLPHLLCRSGLGIKSALLKRWIVLDRVTKNFSLDELS